MLCRGNMKSNKSCPRGENCKPLSNIVSDTKESFVCVGYHNEANKDYPEDKFRHCFKSAANNDSMFDYDEYDLKSVISVMSEALLIDEINKKS